MPSRRCFLNLALLLAIVSAALLLNNGGAAYAQDGLPPIADIRDLSIRFDTVGITSPKVYAYISNHSTIPMRNVQVRLTTDPPAALERVYFASDLYDRSSGIVTIPEINIADRTTSPFSLLIGETSVRGVGIVKVRAEIIGSMPAEGATQLDNNRAEIWVNFSAIGDFPVRSNTDIFTDVVNRSPAPGENHVFTVTASQASVPDPDYLGTYDYDEDVVVKVALSEGLAFASGRSATPGTTFSRTSPTTGAWRLGSGERVTGALRVPVRLSTAAAAAPPLNRRCLTAQIMASRPPASLDKGGVHTVCLGARKAIVLSDGDAVITPDGGSCGPPALYPCREGETLILAVEVESEQIIGKRKHRPEDVIFRVDPVAHQTAGTINGTTWLWQTGHALSDGHDDYDLPGLKLTRVVAQNTIAESRKFTISDVDMHDNPGTIAIIDRYLDSGDVTLYEALNPDKNGKLTDSIEDSWDNTYDHLVVFSEPGLYKVNLGIEWTLKSDNSVRSVTGILTFVVGDVAELQVHDAGLHGRLPRGQQAYTLRAENNQDGTVEQVEVALTGVPRGAKAEVSSDGGRYNPGPCDANGLCQGSWKIGDLEGRDDRYLSGRSDGPTLTLLVEGNPEPITATIISKQTRTVTAGGQTYTIEVFDLDDSNSKDVLVSVGTGRGEDGDPGMVKSLRIARLGSISLLQWEPVEKVSRWPVAYYQVERNNRVLDDEVKEALYLDLQDRGGNSVYRVRAVSDQGVAGPWASVDKAKGTQAPYVVRADITSSPAGGDTYQLGETIAVDVIFSEAVRVQGSPTLSLDIGGVVKQVAMTSHRGNTLTFRYTVSPGDQDAVDGVSVPRNGLTLPDGASITDAQGDDALLAFPGLLDQAGHKVRTVGDPSVPPEQPPAFHAEPPPAPAGLTATAGDGQVTLEWAAYCCDGKEIIYQLWRGDHATWADIPGSNRDTDRHTVIGLVNDTAYRFQLRAVYIDGEGTRHPGAASRAVVATPHAPPPNRGPNNPPEFQRPAGESFSVMERAPRGTHVATVRATDLDGDRLTYTLSGEHHAKFGIANVNGAGEITVAEAELSIPWSQNNTSFTIGVEVSDDRGGRDSRLVMVELEPSSQRNNAPVVEEPENVRIACGAAVGAELVTLRAKDPEGDALRFMLVDADLDGEGGYFKFQDGTTGDHGDFWGDTHGLLIHDGSNAEAVIEVAAALTRDDDNDNENDLCGRSYGIIVEVEEADNPANSHTLQFGFRIEPETKTSWRGEKDQGFQSFYVALREWGSRAGAGVRSLFDAVGWLPGSVRWSWMSLQDEDPTAATQEVRPPPD